MPDYINIDNFTSADIQHDLTTPLPYKDNSVDEIRSIHVVEHFTRTEWEFVRKDWARILKPGGSMYLVCPNFETALKGYLKEPENRYWLWTIYGLQEHPGEFHKNGFTETSLAASFPDFTYVVEPSADNTELKMRFTK